MWDELPQDVYDELKDPRFETRQHHSRSTSRDGCRGPLCKKAEREYKAKRDARLALAEGRTIKSLPPDKRRPGDTARDELLNEIFAWHMLERSRPKGIGPNGESVGTEESSLGLHGEDDDSVRERANVSDATQNRSDSVVRSVPA